MFKVLSVAMVMVLSFFALTWAGNAFVLPSWAQGWLPFVGSGVAGIIVTLLGLIPAIRGVGSNFTDAALELNKFIEKYKSVLQGDMKQDLMKVLWKLDVAFESLATIMGKVGAKKLGQFLSDIIKQEWYAAKK
jgi:hypothetical protein